MEILKYDEVKKTWYQIGRYQKNDKNPELEIEIHKKLLNIFQAGDFYYYIFSPPTAEIEFTSEEVKKMWGFSNANEFSVEYIYENLHPDDKSRFVAHEYKVTEFFNSLPPEKTLKYKVSYDYRIKGTDGKYKWILQQVLTIQSDDKGSVLRVLGMHTDITHIKTDNKASGLSFIGLDGEPSYHNVPTDLLILTSGKELFTKREKEILKYVVEGKTTHQIADILSVSVHTINSHRKNILQKSECNTVAQLITKTINNGWI
ncbi:PAS domain-containing protein [Flavobacterium salilacus subsp. salilacus]|uniref:LuxR C-terminal-related transcriptional regulator n=1 Tax=Flavobacterium TaxID=237 RepID=UPI001075660A|nr:MULTISPECIES: LuxR C-terminal-related transcriptional regulator [Flavobacterium]KAF2519632.1 PAS domain-containing protein [Flavobacterium salilacus subsp. salilacus]MBE1614466.1 PAS domain-containing protein [Flavobacterium sp. SaA2.13]NDI98470.1 PAS domain-containing protein [Flavobacterium salilacus subsp. altitudinum]